MRKARSLGHKEGEHLGRVNWDDILSPFISPFCRMGQRNKAGPGAGVQKACVECFVLCFLSQHLSLSPLSSFPSMSHSCSTDLFPLHVLKQK